MVVPDGCDVMWETGFRERLCRCEGCAKLFKEARAGYVIDPSDAAGGGGAVEEEREGEEIGENLLDETEDREVVKDVRLECGEDGEEERVRKKAREAVEEVLQSQQVEECGRVVEIQQRIHDFLAENIESDGQAMTHATLRSYLADVRAEVLATSCEKRSQGGASMSDDDG